jgi:hypothetical protein
MTRNGLLNSTNSPCRLLFENVLENIKMFAAYSARDNLKGVPECILMGNLAPVGTGFAEPVFVTPDQIPLASRVTNDIQIPYTRKVPCQAPSFRYYQQFVPINKQGLYYRPQYAELISCSFRNITHSGTLNSKPNPTNRKSNHGTVRYNAQAKPHATVCQERMNLCHDLKTNLKANVSTLKTKFSDTRPITFFQPWSLRVCCKFTDHGKLLLSCSQ